MEPKPYTLACIYGGTPPTFNFNNVMDAVLVDKRLATLKMQVLTHLEGRLLSIDFGRQFTMQINIRMEPMAAEKFAISLQGAKTTAIKNDFAARISAHQSYIMISTDVESAVKEKTSSRRLRLYAMQMVAEHLYLYERPILLYSDLAQSLTLPSKNPNSYVGRFDSRIFEQAVLTARGGPVGSGAQIGAFAWGAEEMIGIPVTFLPSKFPSWAVTQGATQFFAYCDHYGIPANGAVFTDGQDTETYKVDHLPRAQNYPRGHIEVTIQRNLKSEKLNSKGAPAHPERMGNGRSRTHKTAPKPKAVKGRFKNVVFMVMAVVITFVIATLVVYSNTVT